MSTATAPMSAGSYAVRTPLKQIRKVAVLGAGTMGSRIAAHLANAGTPVVLLDIVPADAPADNKSARNAIVAAASDALKKSKPAAFFEPSLARLLTIGNFDDDLKLIADCDWVIEVVAENLEIKRALLKRVDEVLRTAGRTDTIITTNTSGLPVAKIAEGMPEDFRRRWFGTHFFNPPRYMRLLEIIPTAETDPALIAAVSHFGDQRLGKAIVRAKDTPNFIANRIGTFSMSNVIRIMQQQDLSIEEVDALTGSALGWPKTGTFRLGDLVGVDVLAHVAKNFAAQAKDIGDERADVVLPKFIATMLENKWLGDKTKQGFYKKQKNAEGKEDRLVMDWHTLEYKPAAKPKLPALEMAKNVDSLPDRIKQLVHGDATKDKAAAFYWPVMTELWIYAANRIPEISDDIVEIDRAMKTGFNWELGPFEMWDAAGVRETVEKMRAEGKPVAAHAERLLAAGHTHWYKDDASVPSGRLYFDVLSGEYRPVEVAEGVASVSVIKKAHGVVKKNPGASLIDLGDGVACIEFTTKMNALGGDIVSFITQTLKPNSEATRNFDAFVITGDAANFSVGANIMQLLLGIQEGEWDDIDMEIRAFQNMTQAIKFCARPVVSAPYGMCLGGGTEINLHSAARQPHAELYMGLVETGVGLVPGGGGCKEMTLRSVETAQSVRPDGRGESVELMEAMKKNFETIAMAKVSTSVAEARALGFLRESDRVTMNRERLLTDAKERARGLADSGYAPPVVRTDIPAPGESVLATLKLGVYLMREGEFISDHDQKVANWVANVLCGGKVAAGTPVSEQYLLDLEREAFLSLCGEKKTQERIAFTLKTGKPLRN
ncbi:MAG TPA: 3-hydroxyacyl-CoA dehydrogenase/enoyl-CoA hydratase family protein [Acidobacteriaceae bacterium]|nr:3-hydroxyacyl-CoA dehydrogenase/enoyl-CoA hydratase family protein [Acidobacteriaceae bacterium]